MNVYRQVERLSDKLGFIFSKLDSKDMWSLKHKEGIYAEGIFYNLEACLNYLYGIDDAERIYKGR